MKREHIALVTLVIIIVAVLGVYLLSTYGGLENIFIGEEKIEEGDCVDLHFIGKYSNGETFGYSYDDLDSKSDGSPLNIYVKYDESASPPEGYGNYSTKLVMPYGEYYNKELLEGLIGLKEGETTTIGPIQPDSTHGVLPEIGDEIIFSYMENEINWSIYDIEEYVEMPSDYQEQYGEVTTFMYKIKDQSYYVGEIITSEYTYWTNSTKVTKINDTMIWKYTTPQTSINETFTYTWSGQDSEINSTVKIDYPLNSSYVSSYNDSTIVITHNPAIRSNISISLFSMFGYQPYATYTVQNIIGNKINTTFEDQTGNTSYKDFNRTTKITRNQTQSIMLTPEPFPGETLEFLLSQIRTIVSDIDYSYNPFTWVSSFDVKVEEIYKTSDES